MLERLHHAGMQLDNLAFLAATLSHLVHGEGVRNLHSVYQILEFLITGDISLPNINLALHRHFATLLVGFDAKAKHIGSIV